MRHRQSGDTIVEVMLAIALLSAVLFTSWGIVNRSTQIGITAQQRINAVSQMREQAEIIQSKRTTLNEVIQGVTASDPASFTANACTDTDVQLDATTPLTDSRRFYYTVNASGGLQSEKGKFKVFNQFGASARIWVQYVPVPSAASPEYIDFYVRGCWRTAGGQQAEDTSQFILRLNV